MSYQDVKDKLYHGHRRIANNTYLVLARDVPAHTECVVMTLHANVIARFYPDHLKLYSAGYYTRTTKNRLNLALKLAGIVGFGVFQKDWDWYYSHWASGHKIPFQDGMRINYEGTL